MRRSIRLTLSLAMILPAVYFADTAQSQPELPPRTETRNDRSGPETEPQARTNEGRPANEKTVREAGKTVVISKNIRFSHDSAALSLPAQRLLNAKAEYLLAHPGIHVIIEGHCDDRGTDVYNMALGQRRADSVKQYLMYMGIGANRMRTISYGEERPLVTGRDETDWARNRRAQFVIN